MNRGIARRTVFEDQRDVRFFLSRLAWSVRAGELEVHAYCLMTTLFHLLVQSPRQDLSRAMGRVLNDYVRWFNRGRGRDGPLFRGRFRSRPIETLTYRRQVVRYIDANPVLAGVVARPREYPHGSARWYARHGGPIWLSRAWIESEVAGRGSTSSYEPPDYDRVFGGGASAPLARLVERRIVSGSRGRDPLDDLLGAAPSHVLEWMRRNARMADGTAVDLPVCEPGEVIAVVEEARAERPHWRVEACGDRVEGWRILRVGLLRSLCGCSWAEIGKHVQQSDQTALRIGSVHTRALRDDEGYAEAAARLASKALRRCHDGVRLDHEGSASALALAAPIDAGAKLDR